MTTTPAKAQEMLDRIKAGEILFTKAPGGWQIIGPAERIIRDVVVPVTKADGTTKLVHITGVLLTREVQGVTYSTATFSKTASERYHQRSDGSTRYSDGIGTVQVWD